MKKGYSLVELLVAMLVLVSVLSVGVLSYRDFNRRQQVTSAARQIRADLRLAQTEALSGKKPGACDASTTVLNRYNFRRVSSSAYIVEAICASPTQTITVRNATLPPNTSINNFATISFKPIGDGTSIPAGSSISIVVSAAGTAYTETITVRASGDVL